MKLSEHIAQLDERLAQLRKEREALQKELDGRVCRTCEWFDGDSSACAKLFYLPHSHTDLTDLCERDTPRYAWDSALINDPDDFGCNKWRSRE